MLIIKLRPRGGVEKAYRAEPRMRECLDAYALAKRWSDARGDYDGELMEDCLSYVCALFDDAFTGDELLDGYEGTPFALIPQLLEQVIGYVQERIVSFPIPAAAADEA